MESESAIYAEIAAGGSHVNDFYDELIRMGKTPDEIERGVKRAQKAMNLQAPVAT